MVAAALIVGSLAFGSEAALAEEGGHFTKSEISSIRAVWTEYDVSSAAQDALIKKIKSGIILDSSNGSAVVSTQTYPVENRLTRIVSRYADGSIAVSGSEIPTSSTGATGTITPFSVSGCSTQAVTGGTKYLNCQVYTWVYLLSMQFYADYTIYNSSADKINSVYSPTYSGSGYSYSNPTLAITRATENTAVNPTLPATARFSLQASTPLGVQTSYMQLQVGGNQAVENHNIVF